jgi:hypothetical protein
MLCPASFVADTAPGVAQRVAEHYHCPLESEKTNQQSVDWRNLHVADGTNYYRSVTYVKRSRGHIFPITRLRNTRVEDLTYSRTTEDS